MPGAADSDGAASGPSEAQGEPALNWSTLWRGPDLWCQPVVSAGEVAGRWSDETRRFIGLVARAGARIETKLMRRRVEQAWRLRWWTMLSCAAARAFAASLLGMRCSRGSDGVSPPSDVVVRDNHYAGLG